MYVNLGIHKFEFSCVHPQKSKIFSHFNLERSSEKNFLACTPSVHASTITELPDGRLIVAWFGGSREGAGDVKIYASKTDEHGEWGEPYVLLDRFELARRTKRFIKKLGNPLLFYHQGKLHFWVVSVSYGGWSGSSVNYTYSVDCGETWAPFARMQLSPIFNISSLVRCAPIPLSGGGIGLPFYHELACKYGEWIEMGPNGRIWDKARIHTGTHNLQPTVAVWDSRNAFALLRNGKSEYVQVSKTEDGGKSWTVQPDLALHNPNSCLAVLKLHDDSFLLVGNSQSGRDKLLLWRGRGNSKFAVPEKWELLGELENEPGCEFSYPTLIQDSAGKIHVVYTWKREKICHRILGRESGFVKEDARNASPASRWNFEAPPTVTNWFGLLSASFLAGGFWGRRLAKKSCRWIAAGIGVAVMLIPLPMEENASLGMFVYALIDNVSVILLMLGVCALNGKMDFPHVEKWAMFIVIAGLALFISGLGFLPFDIYRYGYDPFFCFMLAATLVLLGDIRVLLAVTIGFVLFTLGIYANFFDVILDPILWIIALRYLVGFVCQSTWKRFSSTRTEIIPN